MRVRRFIEVSGDFFEEIGLGIFWVILLIVLAIYAVISWTKTFLIMHFGSEHMRARRMVVIDARKMDDRSRRVKTAH